MVHIKLPPSDQIWFGFTSMPDIDFSLESSVGDHKITNGHIAFFVISKFKEQKEHAVKELVHQCSCSFLEGMSNRRTAATNLNIQSSHSHSVFTCIVESQCKMDGLNCFKTNRMNLVDLAGTERQEATGATGERQKESHHINRSLTQLGYQKDFLSCRRIENAPILKP
ncbi:kinesin-like protein KIN-12B, partial [Tanacetum coccineum]